MTDWGLGEKDHYERIWQITEELRSGTGRYSEATGFVPLAGRLWLRSWVVQWKDECWLGTLTSIEWDDQPTFCLSLTDASVSYKRSSSLSCLTQESSEVWLTTTTYVMPSESAPWRSCDPSVSSQIFSRKAKVFVPLQRLMEPAGLAQMFFPYQRRRGCRSCQRAADCEWKGIWQAIYCPAHYGAWVNQIGIDKTVGLSLEEVNFCCHDATS